MTQHGTVDVVIPCFRSGEWLEELAKRIENALNQNADWKLILVDDYSNDSGRTWEAIQNLAHKNPRILGIELQKNAGQFHATLCGISHSKADIIVLMDDDLQHHPESIPVLIDSLVNSKSDCVMGTFKNKRHSILRNLGSSLVRLTYSWFHDLPREVQMSSFRAITKEVAGMMLEHKTANPVLGAILLKSSRKIVNIEIDHHSRPFGKSGYKFRKLIKSTLDNLFLATTLPLRVFTYLGLLTFLGSIAGAAFFSYRYYIDGTNVPGFTTLAILQLFLIGITSIGLGLLGEYIDRIIDEVEKKPRWHIRSIVGSHEAENKEE